MIQLVSCDMTYSDPIEVQLHGRNVMHPGRSGIQVNLTLEMYEMPQTDNILEEIVVQHLIQTHGEAVVKELYPERFI